jgi:flagellum-specific ATP synthase
MAVYKDNEDLIQIGAYPRGSSPQIDWAIQQRPFIENFLSQERETLVPWEITTTQLMQIGQPVPAASPPANPTPNPMNRAV